MCLSKKARFKPCKVGYKVMRERDGCFYGESYNTIAERKQGIWVDEKDFREPYHLKDTILMEPNKSYPSGWHIFHSRVDALRWLKFSNRSALLSCIKVSVKEPVAVGYQAGLMRVTVAKQMKILRVV